MQIIDDFNSTIENLMKKEFGGALPFDISFAVPSKTFSPVSADKPTINFYLYDIREDTALRSNEPLLERHSDGTVAKKQPPARVKLFYCVTAWSPAQEDAVGTKTREEHKQLSKALVALIKYPTIPSDVLSGDLIGQQPYLPTTVILPDGIENIAQFWNALEGSLKPFLDYRVTIPLDFHEKVEGRMVSSRISEYGNLAPIYVLAIRPDLQLDHSKGALIAMQNIRKVPIVSLASSASEGDERITVSSTLGLNENNFLMIVDGKKTEFIQLRGIAGVQIPIAKPLQFNHENGTELKGLSLSLAGKAVKLAMAVSLKSTEICVTGRDVSKLKVGEILRLDVSDKIENLQITKVSGPEIGIGDSAIRMQFGGIITNSASSPVPLVGAKVTLLDAQDIYVAETVSNIEGKYIFKKFGIGKGKYTLKVEAQGYQDAKRTIGDVASAGMKDFIFKLRPG